MSNYSALKTDINNNIYENNTQQITGTVLNTVLKDMVNTLGAGYQFAGCAYLDLNPGAPDAKVFYLAGEGLYTNFDNIQVPAGKLGILKWDTRWRLETIEGLGGGGANLTGYISVASTDDLPDEGQPTIGYLCGTNLYLYVGEGGDTKDGKYQNCGGFRGPEGVGITEIEQVEQSTANGGRNTIRIHLSNGSSYDVYTRNGTTSTGLFPTLEALQAAYPSPVVGQYAFVGAGFPADIYVCNTAGTWTDSGADYDGDNVDLTNYATKAELNQLEAEVNGLFQSSEPDFAISDGHGYDIAEFSNGHIKTKNFDSSQKATTALDGLMSKEDKTKLDGIEDGAEVNAVETEEFPVDFSISDENENLIALFKDGHIRTKYFDSKYIFDRLSKFSGKRLSIVGDSISSYSGYPYPNSGYSNVYPNQSAGVTSPSLTWWGIVCDKLGLTLLRNCSWAGSKCSGNSASTTSAEAGCSTKRINDLSDGVNSPDIVIVYIGVNDWIQSVPLGTFVDTELVPEDTTSTDTFVHAYMIMINKIINTYPNARVFCTTFTTTAHSNHDTDGLYPDINKVGGVAITAFNSVVRQIADAFGCGIVDLNRCGLNFANIDTYTSDKIHPNSAGMELFAKTFINELVNKY